MGGDREEMEGMVGGMMMMILTMRMMILFQALFTQDDDTSDEEEGDTDEPDMIAEDELHGESVGEIPRSKER